ncbi:hypothetical protein PAL_GLEAN10008163 [Pteropus alecto]|uniref:Uncharacterized protein n=1 Tax=Pteropus alecto TaxID=9402 RepID=L5K0I7_PTEAL|nr:hypothetical protein PAL_GLEAN10008163 [Pteropus alecto]
MAGGGSPLRSRVGHVTVSTATVNASPGNTARRLVLVISVSVTLRSFFRGYATPASPSQSRFVPLTVICPKCAL